MNIKLRVRMVHLVLWIIRFRGFLWRFQLPPISWSANLLIKVFTELRTKDASHRVHIAKNAAKDFAARAEAFCLECKVIKDESHRATLLTTQSQLQKESLHLQSIFAQLRSPQPFAFSAPLMYMLTSMQKRLHGLDKNARGFQQRFQAFQRIVEGIQTNPNFYCDLLLWALLPGSYSEDQLGDLNEEYLFLSSTEGEALAKKWYRLQVRTSIADLIWEKIMRLAAVATLVDILDRWFKK